MSPKAFRLPQAPPTHSRRVGRIALAALVIVITAASAPACGNNSSTIDSTATAAGAAFPRTLDTVMGSVTIPRPPKRVVVLDTAELDSVTQLGFTPVGAVSPKENAAGGFPDYLADKLKNVTDVGPLREPDLERVAALRPDLILSSKMRHEKIYRKLSGIAPTVFTELTGGPWKDNFLLHGRALGLDEQATAARTAYEARARLLGDRIRAANGVVLPTVSVIRFMAGKTRIYKSSSFSGTVLADIGFPRPAAQLSDSFDPKQSKYRVGPEQIDQADADLLFVSTVDAVDKTDEKTVTANPIWRNMSAVRTGKVIAVSDDTWMSGIGIQAADRMLADVARATGVS
ncbi:ABC transporter substrate-binding protein [Nocardia brasiliensis]